MVGFNNSFNVTMDVTAYNKTSKKDEIALTASFNPHILSHFSMSDYTMFLELDKLNSTDKFIHNFDVIYSNIHMWQH